MCFGTLFEYWYLIVNHLKSKIMKVKFLMAIGVILCTLLGSTASASPSNQLPVHHFVLPTAPEFQVELKQMLNSEKIRLTVSNPSGKRLSIKLLAPSGEVVEDYVTGKNLKQFVKDYDFVGAEEGIYRLEIYDFKDKVKKEINLKRVQQEYLTILNVQ
jgi:hypothetical protein